MASLPKPTIGAVKNIPLQDVYQTSTGIEAAAATQGQAALSFGKGLGQAGDATFNIALRNKVEDDERNAKELDVDFNSRRRTILYGDGTDANPGYYSLKGAAAVEAHPEVMQRLQKERDAVSASAKSDHSRRMFDKSSFTKSDHDFETMGAFQSRARVEANLTASVARQQSAVDDAVLAPYDPVVVATSTSIIRNEVFSQAKSQGWKPETTQTELKKAMTVMYSGMVKGALNRSDVPGAVAILAAHKDKMIPAVAAELDHLLKNPKLLAQTQDAVDKLLSTQLTEEEMVHAAKNLYKEQPELRESVVKALGAEFSRRKTRDDHYRQEQAKDWNSQIASGKTTLSELQKTHPEIWAAISGDYYLARGIEATQDGINKGEIHSRVSDKGLVDSLDTKTPVELARYNLDVVKKLLSAADYNKYKRLQDIEKKRQQGLDTNSGAIKRFEQIMRNNNTTAFSFFDKKASDSQRAVQQKIENEANLFIAGIVEDKKRVPTDIELQAKFNELTRPAKSSSTRAFFTAIGLASPESAAKALATWDKKDIANLRVDIKDMPEEMVAGIRQEFKQRGITPTDDLVEQYAGAHVARDVERARRLLGLNKKAPVGKIETHKPTPVTPKPSPPKPVTPPPVSSASGNEPTTGASTPPFSAKGVESPPLIKEQTNAQPKTPLSSASGNEPTTGSTPPPFSAKGVESPALVSAALDKTLPIAHPLRKIIEAKISTESSGRADVIRELPGKTEKDWPTGILQIKPSTAVQPGLGVAPLTGTLPEVIKQLLTPEIAIEFGTRYFSALLAYHNGDLEKAIAAWNDGFGDTNKLIAKYGEKWLEHSPEETINHIKKVKSFLAKGK